MKFWAVIAFIASLTLNGLAGTTVLGGNTTAQVSDAYPNLFAPAGVTFAIWGIIYLLLIGYCIRLFVSSTNKQPQKADTLAAALAPYFTALSVLNGAWLLAWQYRVIWLSVLLIVAMLVLLARSNLRINGQKLSFVDWATIQLPFRVYFGWLTVATIANSTTWLVSIGWNGGGVSPETWMVAILIVSALIGALTAWRMKSGAYAAVFVWAYFGIWLKHTSTTGHASLYPSVIMTLDWLLVLFVIATTWLCYAYPKGLKRR